MVLTRAASPRSAAAARPARTRGRIGLLLAVLAVLAVARPAPAAADPAPAGAWRFDELGQSAIDAGPHGLDGRLGHSPEVDPADPERIPGLSGGALRFEGTSSVRLPDAAPELALETMTIEAVVRAPSSPGSWRYLVSRGSYECESGAYGLYTAAVGGIAIYVFDGSNYVVSAVARPGDVWDGAWHHVAGTFDGRVLRLYVDGRPVGATLDRPLTIDYDITSPDTAFGDYVRSCSLGFRGDLDLVRLWSGAASGSWVSAEAQRALHPGTEPPPADPPPLPAAVPPEVVPAAPPATGPSGGGPAGAPGAPPRACNVALSRRRIAAGRRSTVHARVTLRGRPARAVRVVAKRRGKAITEARTNARGRVRLKLRVRRPGRVRINAATRPSCAPAYIRVAR